MSNNLLYNDFIVNIYTIGLGTSFYNLLVPLHTNTVILNTNSINKTNQMTANVQAISIISKLSKIMSNLAYILNIVLIFNRKKGGGEG